MEKIIDEYWSDDQTKCASIVRSFEHPKLFKLILKNTTENKEAFKYHINLCEAQDEAEDFCLDE